MQPIQYNELFFIVNIPTYSIWIAPKLEMDIQINQKNFRNFMSECNWEYVIKTDFETTIKTTNNHLDSYQFFAMASKLQKIFQSHDRVIDQCSKTGC